jgi:hypothetical protein
MGARGWAEAHQAQGWEAPATEAWVAQARVEERREPGWAAPGTEALGLVAPGWAAAG